MFVLLLLGAIIVELFIGGCRRSAHSARRSSPPRTGTRCATFSARRSPVYGTIVTSVLALILAVPLSFGIAFYLTELAPAWLRRPVGTAIELLAAIPSIIYGMWGFFVIVPLMAQYIQPWLIDTRRRLPVIGALFQGPPFGTGIFTAALILAMMIIPFIAATMRDVFLTVPAGLQGIGLRRRLHDLGGGALDRAALYPRLGGRRDHARARPRARRDDGGHVRHRQHQPDHHQPVRPGQHHRLARGAGVSARARPAASSSPRCSRWASSCS